MKLHSKKIQNKNKAKNWRETLSCLDGAYAEGTLRAYRTDINAFTIWCQRNKQRPFPAQPKILADFITHEAKHLASSTIKRRLAAIRKIHALLKLKNPVSDEEVTIALRRALRGKRSRPRQALGLTAELRNKLIAACPETLTGKRNRAMIAVGYDILARRSELVSLTCEDLKITEKSISKILIQRSKNDPFGKGRLACLSPQTIKILRIWLEAVKINSGPLFRAIRNEKILKHAMHPHSVNRILKSVASEAGLPEKTIQGLSGHSMRVGAAQDMMTSGINILPIMSAGGWKTPNVVARYVENADLSGILSGFFR